MFKKLLILTLFGTISICFAQSGVDAQIAAIKSASPQERVKLMNSFKRQLMKMNQEERKVAISAMRTKMDASNHNISQIHTQEMQMQHSQKMHEMQNMNQYQMPNKREQEMNMDFFQPSMHNEFM